MSAKEIITYKKPDTCRDRTDTYLSNRLISCMWCTCHENVLVTCQTGMTLNVYGRLVSDKMTKRPDTCLSVVLFVVMVAHVS